MSDVQNPITEDQRQGCPFHQQRQKQYTDFAELMEAYKQKIIADMDAIGLQYGKMMSQVENAAMLGARSEMAAKESAVTPLFYIEVSREGNEKPVTHPIHTTATTLANAYGAALKNLGIYAAAEKVKTRVKKDDEEHQGGLSFMAPDDDDD